MYQEWRQVKRKHKEKGKSNESKGSNKHDKENIYHIKEDKVYCCNSNFNSFSALNFVDANVEKNEVDVDDDDVIVRDTFDSLNNMEKEENVELCGLSKNEDLIRPREMEKIEGKEGCDIVHETNRRVGDSKEGKSEQSGNSLRNEISGRTKSGGPLLTMCDSDNESASGDSGDMSIVREFRARILRDSESTSLEGMDSPPIIPFGNLKRVDEKDEEGKNKKPVSRSQKKKLARRARGKGSESASSYD